MTTKLCIVTPFPSENFFQWWLAFQKCSIDNYDISFITMNDDILRVYDFDNANWNPIREANVVFVYCVRHDLNWEWYNLPHMVKKLMNKKAKMIVQYDLEFLWLFHTGHHPWKKEPSWVKGKSPKEFFKETRVLEIPDAHIVFFNPLLRKHTSKPMYELPLPQLVRYKKYMSQPSARNLRKDRIFKMVAIPWHGVRSAKFRHTVNRVINPLKGKTMLFTCRHSNSKVKLRLMKGFLRGSLVYGMVQKEHFMEFLSKAVVAIDDNDGYHGWSRFAMECALANVPCIGSTPAVKEFFPELYTKFGDYDRQKMLLDKLINNKDLWLRTVRAGKKRVLKVMKTEALVYKFGNIIDEVLKKRDKFAMTKKKKTKARRIIQKHRKVKSVYNEYQKYLKYQKKVFPKCVPKRPIGEEIVLDGTIKEFLNQKGWDARYGKWKRFVEGFVPTTKTVTELIEEEEKPRPKKRAKKLKKLELPEISYSTPVDKTLSIIVAVRNRGLGDSEFRVRNFFNSMAVQTDKNFELVIIDYGSDIAFQKRIFKYCKKFGFKYYYIPAKQWSSPKAINIGVMKATGKYIVQTNVDMIFRADFVGKLKQLLKTNTFIWTVPTFLNEEAYEVLNTIKFPDGYFDLNNERYWWEDWKGKALGAIQCVLKDWFVRVNGYDERMTPYGPCETDLWQRAKRDNLKMVCLEDRDIDKLAMCCHQWHPKSKHFKTIRESGKIHRSREFLAEETVIKEGWNTLSELRTRTSKKFTIMIPVSRSGKGFDRCLRSVEVQNPDEIRAYIDPIKLTGKKRQKVINKLLHIGAKVFLQALTSDSDVKKCRMKQKKAMKKLRSRTGYNITRVLWKRKYDAAKEFLEKDPDWNIHHSAHSDCVRNIHRAMLEAENKWVVRVDDDDEITVDVRQIIEKFGEVDVGIIHGDRKYIAPKTTKLQYGGEVRFPIEVNSIRGSVVILNRDAFREVHNNICHEPWQDFRRWYWIVRAGYKAIYIPTLFGTIHVNQMKDPIRWAEGGGVSWYGIVEGLDKKPVVLNIG